MSRQVKVSLGTWSTSSFGLERPADLEQTLKVAAAFGFDGVELAGFADHVTSDRYEQPAARRALSAMLDDLGLEPVLLAPAPHGRIDGLPPWPLTDDREAVALHDGWWAEFFGLAADLGIKRMRIDPGMRGPLPYGVDYDRVWDRLVGMFGRLAEQGAGIGCSVVWEVESGQPFNKPARS
ncbi:sugar phosphate isomerase/epimerase family protein [Nonomuraea aurantiaca]|uniref:sugar phosphate isomerase/epimerase family protein n=1 Tax=Nonomuraea aurantiaca TaxID=2878562 RepID=UPI0021E6834F|nr:TIM barrel protein [Nonomuraea aurantiaca]